MMAIARIYRKKNVLELALLGVTTLARALASGVWILSVVGGLSVIVLQALLWLRFAEWKTIKVSDALQTLRLSMPDSDGKGLQTVLDWLSGQPAGLALPALGLVAGLFLAITAHSIERRMGRGSK